MMRALGRDAVAAAGVLALASTAAKNRALAATASALRARVPELLAANGRDMEAARAKGLTGAMLDRLALDEKRIEAMARGVEEIAALADPIGTTITQWKRPNGLEIARGMIAYNDADAVRIVGKRSADIEALLGFRGRDEMIHRDDLVILRADFATA